jgi:uncharacterized delta-60 repeat protein
MNVNLHGYPYKVGDTGWVITESLTFRSGVCAVVEGIIDGQYTYQFTMNDTGLSETYNQTQLYPTLSLAQIRAQSLVTPTPSVSLSPSPTPSRTPAVSQTTTLTPTPSPVVYPNLLSGVTWTGTNGTTSVDANNNTVFTSTSSNPNTPVSFETTVSVSAGSNYTALIRYLEGTCQHAYVTIDAYNLTDNVRLYTFGVNVNDPGALAQIGTNNSGVWVANILVPTGYNSLKITVYLFGDPNFQSSALNGYTFRFSPASLIQKFVPYMAPSPTPSSGGTNIYDSVILSDSPIAYWSLNTNLKDMVNNDTLTLYSGAVLTPDSFGNTLTFTETQNISYQPNTASFSSGVATEYVYPSNDNYSLEMWINVSEDLANGSGALVSTIPTVNYTNLLLLNENGVVNTSFTNLGLDNQVNCMLQTADGHVYIGGTFTQVGSHTYGGLARLTSDGALDTTFVDLNANSNGNGITALYQAADGHIYVGGDFTTIGGQSYNSFARLTSTGTLDTTFTDLGISGSGVTFVTQTADTHIYVIGNFSQWSAAENYLIGRLNSDGTVDTSFNSSIGINGLPNLIYQTTDGKIYMGGDFTGNFLRLNSDGTVDNTFTSLNIDSTVYDIIQTADSKIYLTGIFSSVGGSSYPSLARLNSDGTLDTTFTALSGSQLIYSVLQVPNGEIYIAGTFFNYPESGYNNLFRLTSSGVFDTSFAALPYINFNVPAKIYSINNGNDLVFYGSGQYINPSIGFGYDAVAGNGFYIQGAVDFTSFTPIINFGQTYHVVLSVSDNTATLYLDGVPYSGSSALTETYNYNAIGIDNDSELFQGVIGNIAFYNTALNQTQVTNHYNAGKTGYRYNVTPVTPTPTPTPSPSGIFSVTVSGAGTSAVNGTYTYTGSSFYQKPQLFLNGDTNSYVLEWNQFDTWGIENNTGTIMYLATSTGITYPWQSSWTTNTGGGVSPAPTVTNN